jgi:hypothetical protein
VRIEFWDHAGETWGARPLWVSHWSAGQSHVLNLREVAISFRQRATARSCAFEVLQRIERQAIQGERARAVIERGVRVIRDLEVCDGAAMIRYRAAGRLSSISMADN